MAISFVPNVINRQAFLEHYGELLLISNQYARYEYVHLANMPVENPDPRFKDWITNSEGSIYPLLPVLNNQNTTVLASELMGLARDVALASAGAISSLARALKTKPHLSIHNIINSFVLADLWQRVFSNQNSNNYGGSLVIVDNPGDCKVIYSKLVGISSDQLIIYWQNGLQPNNHIYHKLWSNKYSTKMIRTLDAEGFILPYGGMEDAFIMLGLARTKRVKGSHVPSYIINIPELNLQLVQELQSELRELTKIGNAHFPQVKQVVLGCRQMVFPELRYVKDCNLLQAAYYTWCYAVYQEWLKADILESLAEVKNIFGVKS